MKMKMNMLQRRMTACILTVFLLCSVFLYLPPVHHASALSGIVTRSGSQLMLNGSPFRFSGANAYWMALDEAVGGIDAPVTPEYPTTFRVDEALDTVAEMGGTVVRTFAAVSVGCSKCIEPSLGTFNETALKKLDYVVKAAGDRGIRLVLPLVDSYTYYDGGISTYTGWRGLSSADAFYTNTTVISDFETYISTILNRKNTLTGNYYKSDPTILAWETGNELHQLNGSFPPTSWTQTIADHIKNTIGDSHLVMDGEYNFNAPGVNGAALSLANVDIYDDHFYPLSVPRLNSDASMVFNAGKVFYAGEYAWNERCSNCQTTSGDTLGSFLSAIETGSARTTSGDSFWSIFPHLETNSYVQHGDGFTLHYPGENKFYPGTPDMRTRAQTLRNHAYAMRSMTVPGDGIPAIPVITNVTGNADIAWRGAEKADTYTVERATAGLGGPWTIICYQCATDNDTPWTDSTAPAGTVWYRVKGHNIVGVVGSYSPVYQANISGPGSTATIVDALNDWSKTFSHTTNLGFDSSNSLYVGGDTSRAVRTTRTYENIAYFAGLGNTMTSFSIDTWFWPYETNDDFKIYISPDNSTYTPLNPTKTIVNGSGVSWNKVTYSGNLPLSTHYLKIEYPNTSAYNWNPEIGSATYTIGNNGTTTAINNTNSGITYYGSWYYSPNRGVGDYQDDVHVTATNNDFFQYTFTGTGIDYITETNTDRGYVDIYIDGIFQRTVNCNSPWAVQQTVYSIRGLTLGTHTLKAVKTSGTYMALDELVTQS